MEMFASLLCVFSMFAGAFFIVAIIVRKVIKKPKKKLYSKGLLISVLVFIASIVLFVIFETPETKAEAEQRRLEQQQEKELQQQEKELQQQEKELQQQKKTAEEDKNQMEETKKENKSDKQVKSSESSSQDNATEQQKPVEKHIYDEATVRDVINGTRDKKIGEYSIIECLSTDINEEVLADWYYNYVIKNDYNWCMLLFTDTKDDNGTYLGAYAIKGEVEYNVKYTKDKYGDYEYSSNIEYATMYLPNGNGTFTKVSD